MSKTDTSFSRQINSSTQISIVPVKPEITYSSSVYAINWFNLKSKWLYDFYNTLAAPLVLKVEGKVHFKGFKSRKILGEDKYGRDALLIVNYNGFQSFFELISKTYFQAISILRISAVKQFNFGFTERLDDKNTSVDFSQKHYLVHHYLKKDNTALDLNRIKSIVAELNVDIYYSGEKVANIARTNKNGDQVVAPFMMDGIIILEGNNSAQLEELSKSNSYTAFLENFDNNYLALFERVA